MDANKDFVAGVAFLIMGLVFLFILISLNSYLFSPCGQNEGYCCKKVLKFPQKNPIFFIKYAYAFGVNKFLSLAFIIIINFTLIC